VIPPLIQKAKKGHLSIIGDGENLIDLLYVENAAVSIVSALNHLSDSSPLAGESYFITEESPLKCWDFVNRILHSYEIPPLRDYLPLRVAMKRAWMLESFFQLAGIKKPSPILTNSYVQMWGNTHFFSSEKALKHFQFKAPVSLEEGLKKTFSFREKIRLHLDESGAK
jgi:nucleoside-diphosphate-sugar epimerase